jgi:hypothetical protein
MSPYPSKLTLALLLTAVSACSDDDPVQKQSDAVTYHKHIRPIVESNCTSCHVQGGSGPFALDRWEAVQGVAPLVVGAVTSQYMPPWPASDECHDLLDVRRLGPEQRALFRAWQENDYAQGQESEYVPPSDRPGPDLGEPNLVLAMPAPFMPDLGLDDTTRCFLTEGAVETDTYLTAMDIRPGTRSLVHHVQVHRIAASDIAAVRAVDARSEMLGYPCAEDGVTSVNMFSWRPGSQAVQFGRRDGVLLEAGSAIMLQVHYNTQFLAPGAATEADRTSVAFWTLPAGETPEQIVVRFGHFGLLGPAAAGAPLGLMAAGEPHVVGGNTLGMSLVSSVAGQYVQGELIGMTPHMHMLGTRLTETLKRQDGSEACMVDVPNWDFEWQLDYYFRDVVAYGPQDQLALVCEYDNTAANQAILDGKRVEPRNVTWGEGSFDEMCLNYVWIRYPRDAYLAAKAAGAPPAP